MLLGQVLGLFFRRKIDQTLPPERQAYDRVWNREIHRLGEPEVLRRLAAVNDYRSGRTGPSGFEVWNMRLEREVMQLAYEIADRDDR